MVDFDETSHCELAVGQPKFRVSIPKNTRLKLGLHELEDDEKVILDADISVSKIVNPDKDKS